MFRVICLTMKISHASSKILIDRTIKLTIENANDIVDALMLEDQFCLLFLILNLKSHKYQNEYFLIEA